MTLICVPITVDTPEQARRDAALAAELGADLVEFRVDGFFSGSEGHGSENEAADALVIAQVRDLIAQAPVPVILTCRLAEEGGDYDGDESDRVSFFEKICVDNDHPPAYLDVELAAYTRSANIRQKINLCVDHPKQQRAVRTRLILSMHDFQTRPADLTRKLTQAWAEPAASVVKFAFRARSIRDNLEIFEILRDAPKPTIGLGMGEFGLMSRVLAPKFGGFLTFASLRDAAATAPGQPTITDLLDLYRFRSIGRTTKVYGVMGWPVAHSMSPLVHNAGFGEIGFDGVYLPMPIAAWEDDPQATATSFRVTIDALFDDSELGACGASVTLPFKEHLAKLALNDHLFRNARQSSPSDLIAQAGAANTIAQHFADLGRDRDQSQIPSGITAYNTDIGAVDSIITAATENSRVPRVLIAGAGGVARSAAQCALARGAAVFIHARKPERAQALVDWLNNQQDPTWQGSAHVLTTEQLPGFSADLFINCTPVGMTGGPAPDALPFPIDDLVIDESTTFFDTVYNPIDTPMLKAARARGCKTVDGVEMFVRQAAAQFELWTEHAAPKDLFDRLVREKLGKPSA